MPISNQIQATAEILLAAAHADGRYLPEERELVEQILRAELGDSELPPELASRIAEFEPDTFELVDACARLEAKTPARRRRILAQVARVVEVDEIHDLDESHFIRRLARCIEAEPEEFAGLTVEVEQVVARLPPPIPPRRP
jgi:uncharacterized tellurite resistance protein B-like protein